MSKSRKVVSLDWAIKKLLRSKVNFVILEGFLSELLYEDITIEEILESESNQDYNLDKFNRVDIKIKNSKAEIIIVEIQFDYEYDYFQRMLYGTSKALVEHIKTGDAYGSMVKVISINILYFELGLGSDYVYHGFTDFVGIHDHHRLKLSSKQQEVYKKEFPSDLYPEYYLIKVNGFDNVAKNSLDEWIYFLKNEEIKAEFKAKGIKEAYDALSILNLSDKEKKIYDKYEDDRRYSQSIAETYKYDLQFARQDGEKIGIEKGEKLKALEIAKELLADGFPIDKIQKITGLELDEIENLTN